MGESDDVIAGPLPSEIKTKTVRGVAVIAASQLVRQAVQLGTVAVMARLLTPRDYGLIGMVLAFTALAAVFANLGLSAATVQRQDLNERQVSTLFWVNVGFGAFLAFVVAGAAPVVAWFYGERELLWIGIAMGAQFVIAGLQAQHGALLSRRMQFGRIAAVEVCALLCGSASGITSALAGWGPYALIAQSTVHAFVRAGGSWIASGWLPGPPVRGSGVRQMLRFGGYLTGGQVFIYAARHADKLLIGRYCGSVALGLYSRAYSLLYLPIRMINAPMSAVMFPTLSRLQGDPERYVKYYQNAVLLITGIGMPMVAMSFAAAEELILLFLGEQWVESVPIFRALAVGAWVGTFNVATGWVFLSLGQMRRRFVLTMITAPIFVMGFVIGLRWGPIGVALSFSLVSLLIRPLGVAYCFRRSPLRLRHLGEAIAVPAVASLVAGAVAFAVAPALPENTHLLVRLILLAAVCGACYTAVWGLLPQGRRRYREAKNVLLETLLKRSGSAARNAS